MKSAKLILLPTALAAVAAVAAVATLAAPALAAPITFQQLPPAVQATVTRETQGGTIEEIELEDGQGVVTYEVEFRLENVRYELEIAANGALLRRKLD